MSNIIFSEGMTEINIPKKKAYVKRICGDVVTQNLPIMINTLISMPNLYKFVSKHLTSSKKDNFKFANFSLNLSQSLFCLNRKQLAVSLVLSWTNSLCSSNKTCYFQTQYFGR